MARRVFSEVVKLCFAVFLLLLHTHCEIGLKISNVTDLGLIQKETKLPCSREQRLTTNGLMICACSCILTNSCASFNFKTSDGQCELNSKASTSDLQYAPSYVYSTISNWPHLLRAMCKVTINSTNTSGLELDCIQQGCSTSEIPVIANATLKSMVSVPVSPVGTVLEYNCGGTFTQQTRIHATCKNNGDWTSDECVPLLPGSCKEIKEAATDSEDGEYWLSLKSFNVTATKIYCHNMNTDRPEEFLTLHYDNYGVCPKIRKHGQNTVSIKRGGEVWFHKIKLNVTDMSVSRYDLTFSTVNTTVVKIHYAEAHDCYFAHKVGRLGVCGTVGRFLIDLRGTGWRVHPDQLWEPKGFKSIVESVLRTHDGSVIHLKCGGYCGYCVSSGELRLVKSHEGDSR